MRIGVLGATGVLGEQVARNLAEQGIDAVLCGRSEPGLRGVAARTGGGPLRVFEAGDAGALAALCAEVDAVISAVGPHAECGERAVIAAIRAGVPYLDATVEQRFARRCREGLGQWARARGAVVVNGMGLFGAGSEALLVDATRSSGALARARVASAVVGGGVGPAFLRAGRPRLGSPGLGFEDGWLRGRRTGDGARALRFDAPIGGRPGIWVPGVEALAVPRVAPIRTVEVWAPLPGAEGGEGLAAQVLVETDGPAGPQRATIRAGSAAEITARLLVAAAGAVLQDGPACGHAGALTPTMAVDAATLLGWLERAGAVVDRRGH